MSIAALQSAKKPWTHLLVLHEGQKGDLSRAVPASYVVRTVAGGKCKTKAGLLSQFAHALSFPDYFGHNWDALEECLADLDWLPAHGYLIVVTEADQVLIHPDEEDDYQTFIEILAEAGEAWSTKQAEDATSEGTPFHTVLAVMEKQAHKRKNWLAPSLVAEHKPALSKRPGNTKTKEH